LNGLISVLISDIYSFRVVVDGTLKIDGLT
jgi:hypothetical protein